MTFRFLPDAFYASKHQPWLDEAKYGNTLDNQKTVRLTELGRKGEQKWKHKNLE